jgi:hypothetical protein
LLGKLLELVWAEDVFPFTGGHFIEKIAKISI